MFTTLQQLPQLHSIRYRITIEVYDIYGIYIHFQAYRKYGQRLLDQEIVLIMHGRYMTEWWETAYERVNSSCTREQVMMALNNTLALTPQTYDLIENASTVSYSGIVSMYRFCCTTTIIVFL